MPKAKQSEFSVQWHRAPLYFFPEMATTPADWFERMSATFRNVEKSLRTPQTPAPAAVEILNRSPHEFQIVFWENDDGTLTIDAENNLFSFSVDDCDDGDVFTTTSQKFCGTLNRSMRGLSRIPNIAKPLWQHLQAQFYFALENELALVKARPRTPLAEFENISVDQIRCFSVIPDRLKEGAPDPRLHANYTPLHGGFDRNRETDMAGPGGEVLYSVRVFPGRKLSASETKVHRAYSIKLERLRGFVNSGANTRELQMKAFEAANIKVTHSEHAQLRKALSGEIPGLIRPGPRK